MHWIYRANYELISTAEIRFDFLPFVIVSEKNKKIDTEPPSREANEAEALYQITEESQKFGFVLESEDDRLLKDASRSGIEKLQLFTQMIRRNRLLKRKDL